MYIYRHSISNPSIAGGHDASRDTQCPHDIFPRHSYPGRILTTLFPPPPKGKSESSTYVEGEKRGYANDPKINDDGIRMNPSQPFNSLKGHNSHQHALAALGRHVRVLRLLDLVDQELECLADVLVVARTRLGPRALELLGQLLSLLGRHLPLLGS